MPKRIALVLCGPLIAVLAATGCTDRQISAWLRWHATDPAAAEAFADRPEVQQQLRQRSAPRAERTQPRQSSNEQSSNSNRSSGGGTVWDRLAQCESNGRWDINTGNGYFGGLQFTLQSWRATGGTGYPHQHSREEQIRRAEILLDRQGWSAWPACSRQLGLR